MNRIFSRTAVMERAVDAAAIRNEVISDNIANIDTPGYKRKTVAFEEYLNKAIEKKGFIGYRTNEKHLPIGVESPEDTEIRITQDNKELSMRLDKNNVDIDSEMALLAKNSIKYNTLIERISKEFKDIKMVINEGRR